MIETDRGESADQEAARRIADALRFLEAHLPIHRRVVRTGDVLYRAGDRFEMLYVLNSGFVKIVSVSEDGREHLVGLHFKGDWLGFDGIASSAHSCDAVALDIGEVWGVRYEALLEACTSQPGLLHLLHQAMSREIGRDRETMLSLCTLPADARVAEFLRHWAGALSARGIRTDEITLRMTRSEIGNYLGMTLESVSRALSRLARTDVIRFSEKDRRHIQIPRVAALTAFIESSVGVRRPYSNGSVASALATACASSARV